MHFFYDFCNNYSLLFILENLLNDVLVEDIERNNGKDKPYFMDEDLLDIMGLENQSGQIQDGEKTSLVAQKDD